MSFKYIYDTFFAPKNRIAPKLSFYEKVQNAMNSIEKYEKHFESSREDTIILIENLLYSNSEFFDDVEIFFHPIIKQRNIEFNDIIYIVTIYKELYKIVLSFYEKSKKHICYEATNHYSNVLLHILSKQLPPKNLSKICGNILKFILHACLLEESLSVKMEVDMVIILLQSNKMIDSCSELSEYIFTYFSCI